MLPETFPFFVLIGRQRISPLDFRGTIRHPHNKKDTYLGCFFTFTELESLFSFVLLRTKSRWAFYMWMFYGYSRAWARFVTRRLWLTNRSEMRVPPNLISISSLSGYFFVGIFRSDLRDVRKWLDVAIFWKWFCDIIYGIRKEQGC